MQSQLQHGLSQRQLKNFAASANTFRKKNVVCKQYKVKQLMPMNSPAPRLLQPITLSPPPPTPLHASVTNLRTCHCPASPCSTHLSLKNPHTLCNCRDEVLASIYRNQFVVIGDLIANRQISVKHICVIDSSQQAFLCMMK